MKLRLFRHLWGIGIPWQAALDQIAAAGYAGVESSLPPASDRAAFAARARELGLAYTAQTFSDGPDAAAHAASLRPQLEAAAEMGAERAIGQTGRDAFDEEEASRFFEAALKLEEQAGIPLAHETHRSRVLFNPWATRRVLQRFEPLKICCDFSHWVTVCERLNWDDADGSILKLCAERCIHTHARVGYEEGPQIDDPDDPAWARQVAAHEGWWDTLWQTAEARGQAAFTITPEFGPPNYQHTLPYTRQPPVSLADVVERMKQRLAKRYGG